MDYRIILRPLIGAGIGYVTNWIAVKMLFRPLKPIKIVKFTLPFTPGIIPKNKGRIAEAIGNTISENLLTEETLKETLLSQEMLQNVKNIIISKLNDIAENDSSVQELLIKYIGDANYTEASQKINNHISSSIFDTIKEYDLGKIVAEQIEVSAKEKMKGSLLGIFGGNSIVSSVAETASLKINDYINQNGKELISNMVSSEFEKYTSMKISSIAEKISGSNINLVDIILNIYQNFVIEKIPEILELLNISKIVEDKINSMDMLELEKLILNIMKKELNALVNLGALIGLLLGLLNLLF